MKQGCWTNDRLYKGTLPFENALRFLACFCRGAGGGGGEWGRVLGVAQEQPSVGQRMDSERNPKHPNKRARGTAGGLWWAWVWPSSPSPLRRGPGCLCSAVLILCSTPSMGNGEATLCFLVCG